MNKRKPSSRSKDSKECFFGKWLNKQYTHNHKESIIISKWNNFIHNYIDYIETSDMKWHKRIESIISNAVFVALSVTSNLVPSGSLSLNCN